MNKVYRAIEEIKRGNDIAGASGTMTIRNIAKRQDGDFDVIMQRVDDGERFYDIFSAGELVEMA